jgi:hypothetical protein
MHAKLPAMPPSSPTRSGELTIWRKVFLAVLIAGALVSLGTGIRNALAKNRSQDFQWSGAHLLVNRVDPWLDFIQGDPEHLILLIQIPNYLPLLYVMLAPLGAMPLASAKVAWLIVNVSCCFVSAVLCSRFYGLRTYDGIVLGALLLMSTAARNSIGLGQQSLLVLLFWAVALCTRWKRHNPFTFGLSYFKYSFAPPGFLFLVAEESWIQALLSLLPAAISFFLVYFWLGGSLFSFARMASFLVEPLAVAQKGYVGRPGPNLMEIIQDGVAGHHPPHWFYTTTVYIIPTLLSAAMIFYFALHKARFPTTARIAFLALISLALFKHHSYDNALLIFPAALALRYLKLFAAKMVLALLCFSWFMDRLIDQIAPHLQYLYLVQFAALVLMGLFLYRMANKLSEMREPSLTLC